MKKLAPLFVFLAGMLWGTMGIFVRRLNEKGLGSIEIVAVRASFTSIILFLFLLCYNRKLLLIKLKDIWCFLGTGLLSIIFFNFCYFKAITMTSLSVAAVLLYTAPAIVMILSCILFHEKFTVVKLVSFIATFTGCVLVTGIAGNTTRLSAAGLLTGLLAGLGYALYSIFSRYALEKEYHSFTIAFYTFLIAAVGVLPLCNQRKVLEVCCESVSMVLFSLAFGLFSTVFPFVLYTLGLTKMENGRASIIASVEPVFATLLGIFLFQEALTAGEIVGIILVLSAIVICNINIGQKNK